ncbi:MAG: cyclopropane-fatty-acyl-phospholipid synthase [Pelagibacterales bacterium]|nr:cyclopropane-fatty-acyl-phospholipid synthase [Pelagibacterales bacterium]
MKIKNKFILTLDKYIFEALYNQKSGYYMNKNPFGNKGDYITSPNISILFSEMIAIWVIAFWENLKCPKKFNLIELGAGNGEMMNQIVKTFNKFPMFKNSCKINILEKSVYLKKIQKKKLKNENVRWLKNLNEVSNIPNIFISNEFFDALPIKKFIKKKNQWYERNVKLSKLNCKKFIDIKFDIKKIEKEIGFNISSKQNFIEYSPLTMKYLKIISRKITSSTGGILIIDYGYWDNKMKNTLQSISNHDFNDVLKNFGKADITYNLNFRLIEKMLKKLNLKIIGKESQKNFLINLGILKRAEIISKNLAFSKKVNIYSRIKRLTDKNLMGDLFKVISATKKGINFYTGFTS